MLLDWTLLILVLAIVAGLMGFGVIANESAAIARILFFLFLIIYVVSFFMRRNGSVRP
jgi:uncharacterized membrane protein YtjA (UPF0391 family)